MQQDETLKVFEKVFKQANDRWDKFIKHVRSVADKEDTCSIFMDDFEKVLEKFKVTLSAPEKEKLLLAFPGRVEGTRSRVNIAKLYDQKYNLQLRKLYQKVDVHENDGEDDPVDQSGYTGQFYRPSNKQLEPITEEELVKIIFADNKMKEIVRTISEIDK